jgi:MerR family transcriptional regulator, repressor of the yfmOP operon
MVEKSIASFQNENITIESENNHLSISELSKLIDISPRTIRYYEEIGLMDQIKRTEGGKRIYSESDFRRLRFIKKLKLLGLTLAEMQELNAIYNTHRKNSKVFPRIIELFDYHSREIDHRIEELRLLKTEVLEFQERMRDKLATEEE